MDIISQRSILTTVCHWDNIKLSLSFAVAVVSPLFCQHDINYSNKADGCSSWQRPFENNSITVTPCHRQPSKDCVIFWTELRFQKYLNGPLGWGYWNCNLCTLAISNWKVKKVLTSQIAVDKKGQKLIIHHHSITGWT